MMTKNVMAIFGVILLAFTGSANRLLDAQSDSAPSAGCGSTVQAAEGAQTVELISGGETRSYLLHVPESVEATTPTPLVLTFHGFAGWPAQQMEMSRWTPIADEYGFIVVYPAGTGFPLRWRIGQDFNEAGATDDLAFIADLLDTLSQQFCLDLNRVYANGISNGGGMSYLLACELADRFAAIGTVAGAYIEPEGGCQPSRPVPVIAFHGTDDQIVPYEGQRSRRFSFPSIEEWVAQWAARSGCDEMPEPLPDSGEVSGIEYVNCDADAQVIFYTVNGGGHSWPGGEPLPERLVGRTTEDIDASEVMWEFFVKHSLP